MWSIVVFLALNFASLGLAARVVAILNARSDVSDSLWSRRGGALVLIVWLTLIHSLVLVAGMLERLRWETIAVELAILWIATAFCRAKYARSAPQSDAPDASPIETWFRPAVVMGAAMLATLSVFWLIAQAWWPIKYLFIDDQLYNAAVPVEWLRQGRLWIENPWTFKAYYPQSQGLLTIWFMLPWPATQLGDALAWTGLSGLAIMLWGCLSVTELLSRLGVSLEYRLAAVVGILGSKAIFGLAFMFSDTDLCNACLLLGAIAYSIPTSRADETSARWVDRIVAACSLGLALGTRATVAVPAVPLVLCSLLWIQRTRRRWFETIAAAGIWIAGFFLTGSYWYFRNLFIFGNPSYPVAMLGLPGETDLPASRLSEYARLVGWMPMLREWSVNLLNYYPLLGPLAFIGFAATLPTALRAWRGERRYVGAWWCLLIAGAMLLTYPWQPFSAGWAIYEHADFSIQRYLTAVPFLGIALFFFMCERFRFGERTKTSLLFVFYATLIALFIQRTSLQGPLSLALLGSLVFAMFVSPAAWNRLRSRIPNPARFSTPLKIAAILLVVAGFVVARHRAKAAQSPANRFFELETRLNRLPDGSKIATFNTWNWTPILMLRGDRLQHAVVLVERDGRRAEKPPSEADYLGYFPTTEPDIRPHDFVTNLRNAGVEYVVLGRDPESRDESLPPQSQWLRESGEAELIFQEKPLRQLWKILPRSSE